MHRGLTSPNLNFSLTLSNIVAMISRPLKRFDLI